MFYTWLVVSGKYNVVDVCKLVTGLPTDKISCFMNRFY